MAQRKRFKVVSEQENHAYESWLPNTVRSVESVICDCETGVEYLVYKDVVMQSCTITPLFDTDGKPKINKSKMFKSKRKKLQEK